MLSILCVERYSLKAANSKSKVLFLKTVLYIIVVQHACVAINSQPAGSQNSWAIFPRTWYRKGVQRGSAKL